MNIIVHYPKSLQDAEVLQKEVVVVHANAALRHLQEIPCSREQKMNLHKEMKKAYCQSR